jgi:hypothetical protein
LPEGVFYMTANTTTRPDIIHLRKKTSKPSSPGRVYFANAPTAGIALNSRDTMSTNNALEEVATTVRARGCITSMADAKK